MNNRYREASSDKRQGTSIWYVYILDIGDGEYQVGQFENVYVGQTNNLPVRLLEHKMGVGAQATRGKSPQLVWFTQVINRNAARAVESRIRGIIEESPLQAQEMISVFNQLVSLVKPDKTLQELQQEEQEYQARMSASFHWVRLTIMGTTKAECGWSGSGAYPMYGTSDKASLLKDMDAYQKICAAVGESYWKDRVPCEDCYEMAKIARKDID